MIRRDISEKIGFSDECRMLLQASKGLDRVQDVADGVARR